MRRAFMTIHKILAILIAIAVLAQMFLAGLWHAKAVATPEAHITLGFALVMASVLALLAALIGRMGTRTIFLTGLLFILIILQPFLIWQRGNETTSFLSAFHTLNAAFIGMLAGIVTRLSQQTSKAVERREPARTSAARAD